MVENLKDTIGSGAAGGSAVRGHRREDAISEVVDLVRRAEGVVHACGQFRFAQTLMAAPAQTRASTRWRLGAASGRGVRPRSIHYL
jgi:hypothetical protein